MKLNCSKICLMFLALAVVLPGCSKKKKEATYLDKPSAQVIGTDRANDAVSLKIQLLANKKYIFQAEGVEGLNINLPPPMTSKTNVMAMNHRYAVSVLNPRPDGGQTLQIELTDEEFFYQFNVQNWYDFDSRQSKSYDSQDPVSPLFRNLLHVPIQCDLDGDGKMTKATGFKQIKASLKKGDPQMKSMLESALTEENLKAVIDSLSLFGPKEPVKIGDSWPVERELDIPNLGQVTIKLTCTAAEWELHHDRQCVRIEFRAQIALQAADGAMVSKLESAEGSGKIWFDPALAMPLDIRAQGHLNMQTSAMGMTVNTGVNLTENVRLLSMEDR